MDSGPDRLREIATALVARYRNRHCPRAVLALTDELHALAGVWEQETGLGEDDDETEGDSTQR